MMRGRGYRTFKFTAALYKRVKKCFEERLSFKVGGESVLVLGYWVDGYYGKVETIRVEYERPEVNGWIP